MITHSLVSILIPAYNSEKWIKAAIQSALAQTWQNKEIIIVDDGSSDNTFQIAKEFESKTVKVISQKNSGACAARNRALSLSQGDFIQWLDSDDILAPDKIEIQLSNSDVSPQTRVLHLSGWGFFYFRIKKARFVPNPLWQDLSPLNWLLNHIGEGYYMYPAAWLVSRKLTELAGPWDERIMLNQDGEYFCRVVATSEMVKFSPKALSYHRIGNLYSISGNKKSKKTLESLNLAVNLCIDYLLKLENSETTRKASINCLQKIINTLYQNDSSIIGKNQKRIIELGGSITPVSRTTKFTMVQKILGLQKATTLKTKFWNLEILIRRNWDKLLSVINRDAT